MLSKDIDWSHVNHFLMGLCYVLDPALHDEFYDYVQEYRRGDDPKQVVIKGLEFVVLRSKELKEARELAQDFFLAKFFVDENDQTNWEEKYPWLKM
jgi:hypothetical protein